MSNCSPASLMINFQKHTSYWQRSLHTQPIGMTPGKELSVAQASQHFWCQSLQNDKSIFPFPIEKTPFQSLLTLLSILSARISGILMPQRDIANAPAAPEMRTLRATQITVAIHAIHQTKKTSSSKSDMGNQSQPKQKQSLPNHHVHSEREHLYGIGGIGCLILSFEFCSSTDQRKGTKMP